MINLITRFFREKIDFLVSVLIFVFLMSVYLFTMPLSITTEDSGELVAAAITLGIPHPSGYPLWTILGHLFSLLPFGPIVWRVNLLSAVCGTLTCVVIYLILRRLIKPKFIALISSLLLGLSYTFWTQATYAKFYTLNTLLICLTILVLLIWQEKKQNFLLYLFALIYGLALTNHTMTILLAPAITLFIIINEKEILKNPFKIVKMFLGFCLGLSVYGYLLWRGLNQEAFIWVPIGSFTDFLGHIMRWQYNDFSPLASQYGKIGIIISFFLEITLQFFAPTLALALIGAWVSFKKNLSQFTLFAGIFLLNSLGIIYLRSFGYTIGLDYTYRVYYLPAFCMVVIFFGLAIGYAWDLLPKILKSFSPKALKIVKIFFCLAIISIPISFLLTNYRQADRSGYWLGYDYAKSVLSSIDENGVYYFNYDNTLQGDTEIFNLVYFKKVENYRPDVLVVSENNFFRKEINLSLPPEYFSLEQGQRRGKMLDLIFAASGDRPIYTNFALTLSETGGKYFSVSNGITFRIFKSWEQAKSYPFQNRFGLIRNLSEINEESDLPARGLAAHCYYNLAAWALVAGDDNLSDRYLNLAFRLDPIEFSHEYTNFLTYRFEWKNKEYSSSFETDARE